MRRALSCGLAMLLLVGAAAVPAQDAAGGGEGEASRFYIVFSSRMFTEVHENDAKAALKAWSAAFTQERHLSADAVPVIVSGVPELRHQLQSGKINILSLPTDEYFALGISSETASTFVPMMNGRIGEEYLLLVHADAGIASLTQLGGRSLLVHENTRTTLAPYWLDELFLAAGLPPADRHCGRVGRATKLTAVVLPVFFRQADACLVTRTGFETMIEMNPQLGIHMKVLATSPVLFPSIGLYFPSATGALRGVDLLGEMRNLHSSTAGRQILTLFQSDRLAAISLAELDGSRELLNSQRRLLAAWEAKRLGPGNARAERHGSTEAVAAAPPTTKPGARTP